PCAADAPGLRNAHDAALLRPGPPPAFRPGRGRPAGARHGAGAEGGPRGSRCPGPAATLLRLPVRLRARHGWLRLPVAGGDGRWLARELRHPVQPDAEQVSVGGQYLVVAAELALLAFTGEGADQAPPAEGHPAQAPARVPARVPVHGHRADEVPPEVRVGRRLLPPAAGPEINESPGPGLRA